MRKNNAHRRGAARMPEPRLGRLRLKNNKQRRGAARLIGDGRLRRHRLLGARSSAGVSRMVRVCGLLPDARPKRRVAPHWRPELKRRRLVVQPWLPQPRRLRRQRRSLPTVAVAAVSHSS